MCGIFGYFDREKKSVEFSLLEAMGKTLIHRGPDDQGIYAGEGVGLGNQRLSIIDIEHGHQPFQSEDNKIIVVQNGEIYNYVELARELEKEGYPCRTHSDTEVLLRLYQREGIDFVSRLNGMFAIAIYDGNQDQLFLVRDRIGVKPLYIHDDGKRLWFASEIKTLLEAGISPKINYDALDSFLTYNFVPPPHTLFKGITHLMPGHWMRLTRNNSTVHKWWDLAKREIQSKSEADWTEEFLDVLNDAVKLRLRSDVPFGAFLSGGVDSSTIVGLMAKNLNQPVNTFSIGFHEKRFDEAPFAQEAADRFNTHHIMERVDSNMLDLWPKTTYHCDQPHGDISFLPTYRVAELAAQHVKVVLTGDGGDELFAGYDKYLNFFTAQNIFQLSEESFRKAYYKNISLFSSSDKKSLYTFQLASQLQNSDPYKIIEPLFGHSSHMDRINQALYIDMMLLLPGNNLVKPDRMGMAVSLEARTPFLDYRMMELAFRMPGDLKLKNGETKYLFKKAVTPLIGKNLAYRKKQMFTVPVGEWIRKELYEFAYKMILSKNSLCRDLFNPNYIEEMLKDHQSGKSNFTREIRALMALEIWHERFINRDLHDSFSKICK